MKLLTGNQQNQLITNGRRQAAVKGTPDELDLPPVVKLFTPDAACTWLLTEIDPDDTDIAWGLCDLGFGTPEFGPVRLSELTQLRGHLGLPVERDLHWTATAPISVYLAAALRARWIVEQVQRVTATKERP
jgi:hypothetical protein